MRGDLNFLDYLSGEEHNLLVSLVNLKPDFDVFSHLDGLYKLPLQKIEIKESEAVIPSLFLFVHFHFYFSISCLLRSHLSECLGSVRKGIDASLSAYKIFLEPESEEAYRKREWVFQTIKGNIKKDREKDPSRYPLAEELIPLHEKCSEYGAHADFSALEHRIEVYHIENSDKRKLAFQYFDYPSDRDLYHCLFVDILKAFHIMLLIFQPFMVEKLTNQSTEWASEIKKLGEALNSEQEKCHNRISSDSKNKAETSSAI